MNTQLHWERLRRRPNGSTRPAKWSLQQQARLCRLLADQLGNGFSLKQAVAFIRHADEHFPADLAILEGQLMKGTDFLPAVQPYLQPNVYFQLTLTAVYGELQPALAQTARLLELMARQHRRFWQLLAYPLGLLLGMGGLLAALQWGILPQLQDTLAPQQPTAVPGWHAWQWGGGLLGGGLLASGAYWWHTHTALQRTAGMLRWPVIGQLLRAYYAYFLTETLSQMVRSGLSVQQMLRILNRLPPHTLLYQLAQVLVRQLDQGILPKRWLTRQPYIPDQLIVMLQKGSPASQLARELTAYSQLQYRELVRDSERGLAWVQPVLLTVVAGLIVSAYLRLLLPLYENLQGVN